MSELSPFPFEEIMTAISKKQKGQPAVVILGHPDGTLTILRLVISKVEAKKLMIKAALAPYD